MRLQEARAWRRCVSFHSWLSVPLSARFVHSTCFVVVSGVAGVLDVDPVDGSALDVSAVTTPKPAAKKGRKRIKEDDDEDMPVVPLLSVASAAGAGEEVPPPADFASPDAMGSVEEGKVCVRAQACHTSPCNASVCTHAVGEGAALSSPRVGGPLPCKVHGEDRAGWRVWLGAEH